VNVRIRSSNDSGWLDRTSTKELILTTVNSPIIQQHCSFSTVLPDSIGTLKSSADRMCEHKKVKYKCGHSIYHVNAWCHKYCYQTLLPCGPNTVEKSVFTVVVIWAHCEAKLIFLQGETEKHEVWSVVAFNYMDSQKITEPIGSCTRKEHRRQWLAEYRKGRPATTSVHSLHSKQLRHDSKHRKRHRSSLCRSYQKVDEAKLTPRKGDAGCMERLRRTAFDYRDTEEIDIDSCKPVRA